MHRRDVDDDAALPLGDELLGANWVPNKALLRLMSMTRS